MFEKSDLLCQKPRSQRLSNVSSGFLILQILRPVNMTLMGKLHMIMEGKALSIGSLEGAGQWL